MKNLTTINNFVLPATATGTLCVTSNWDSLSCVEAPGGGRSHFCVVGSE